MFIGRVCLSTYAHRCLLVDYISPYMVEDVQDAPERQYLASLENSLICNGFSEATQQEIEQYIFQTSHRKNHSMNSQKRNLGHWKG